MSGKTIIIMNNEVDSFIWLAVPRSLALPVLLNMRNMHPVRHHVRCFSKSKLNHKARRMMREQTLYHVQSTLISSLWKVSSLWCTLILFSISPHSLLPSHSTIQLLPNHLKFMHKEYINFYAFFTPFFLSVSPSLSFLLVICRQTFLLGHCGSFFSLWLSVSVFRDEDQRMWKGIGVFPV